MIVITGAGGFIGSNLITKLNNEGFKDIILVDDFSVVEKLKNIENKIFTSKIDRSVFFDWLDKNEKFVQFIFHIGAKSATTGFSNEVYDELNLNYSKKVWQKCVEYGLPLVYASSAATYGDGKLGYDDNHNLVEKLQPLNYYGVSKNEFDKWALKQEKKPFFWAGLKFFNVYGPNEYHKGRMASVIFHAFNQIKATRKMNLFKSHNKNYKDGEQMRDFVYVKDLSDVMYFLMNNRKNSGIYNLGTGKADTFLELVKSTFDAMEIKQNIKFIDTPKDIRDKYQYFTEAKMEKLRSIGYNKKFYTLREGTNDYVRNYLMKENKFN